MSGAGNLNLKIAGGTNAIIVLETSIDLLKWTTLETRTNLTGVLEISDRVPNLQNRFYRARTLVP